MTPDERKALRLALSRASERAQIREAIAAGAVTGSIDLLLGNELIAAHRERNAASREVIAAWHERRNSEERMAKAIENLERVTEKSEELVP